MRNHVQRRVATSVNVSGVKIESFCTFKSAQICSPVKSVRIRCAIHCRSEVHLNYFASLRDAPNTR